PRREVEQEGRGAQVLREAAGEARRQRRAVVRDDQVAGVKQGRKVDEAMVRDRGAPCHQHADPIAVDASHLRRRGRLAVGGPLEVEFGRVGDHVATSHVSAWAWKRCPRTSSGRLPSNHAQNGSVTSGKGRPWMSSSGYAAWCMSVRMSPGSTLTAVTPSSANSPAQVAVMRSNAALLAPYAPQRG